jgi:hypothetical protein
MTGKFLSEEQQVELDIPGDVAIWYCPSVGGSGELKEKLQLLATWIRNVANNIWNLILST